MWASKKPKQKIWHGARLGWQQASLNISCARQHLASSGLAAVQLTGGQAQPKQAVRLGQAQLETKKQKKKKGEKGLAAA